ncbi:molybdopterin-binding/glycosyltransferase family 2 protein [Coralliovum pocilloporae]|uniref:molybdopterin-binding/glycosyltransferase family 2 protein n=1 Tax=Coralliovum pocilloporae TaxID=3066369 RepID=UPI003307BFA3
MKFGPVRLAEAEGGILAHSVRLEDGALKKGHRLDREALGRLDRAGIDEVVVALLEAGDCHEDEAARRLAHALCGDGCLEEEPFTGRCNLIASESGLLQFDEATINEINRLDPAITVATLKPLDRASEGQIAATIKIIPFAVSEALIARAEALAEASRGFSIQPFRPLRVGLVATVLPGMTDKVMDKTRQVLASRLSMLGARLGREFRVSHREHDVASAIRDADADHDMIIVFGASAIVDRADVVPSSIEQAGGEIVHFGMPVDPGNLLLTARLGTKPVIGAPGCARSPKENGFDWVLERMLAGLEVGQEDIQAMGVGGLLKEITSRPQPRRERTADRPLPRVAAVVLAAGQSRRMGQANKLLTDYRGELFIRRALDVVRRGGVDELIVVTGHDAERIKAAVPDRDVRFAHNDRFADGLSTSVAAGIAAVPDDVGAVLIMLSDMPLIAPETIRKILLERDPAADTAIIVPHFNGQRGNPVLWPRRYFAELQTLSGDQGARALFKAYPDAVIELECGDEGVVIDIDTPEQAAEAGARIEET